MIGVQPCDFAESPLARNCLVLSQATTPAPGPPWLNQSVSLSLAKKRWCVGKQRSACIHFCVFGSYTDAWRGDCSIGNAFAEGWSEPFLQKSAFAAGRKRALNQTRPCASICALCRLEEPSQIGSAPQYAE